MRRRAAAPPRDSIPTLRPEPRHDHIPPSPVTLPLLRSRLRRLCHLVAAALVAGTAASRAAVAAQTTAGPRPDVRPVRSRAGDRSHGPRAAARAAEGTRRAGGRGQPGGRGRSHRPLRARAGKAGRPDHRDDRHRTAGAAARDQEARPYAPLEFDFLCGIYDVPLMLMVKADSPFASVADVIAYARANPGQLAYGSSGQGTTLHITMAALLARTASPACTCPTRAAATWSRACSAATSRSSWRRRPWPRSTSCGRWRCSPIPARCVPNVPSAAELGIAVRGSVWGAAGRAEGTARRSPQAPRGRVRRRDRHRVLPHRGLAPQQSFGLPRVAVRFRAFADAEARAYATAVPSSGSTKTDFAPPRRSLPTYRNRRPSAMTPSRRP